MSAATEEIEAYLLKSASCGDRYSDNLGAGLLFARSMAHELRASLRDWEAAVTALEQLKHQCDNETSN